MGVHTGDSITVAPQQTLSDREYQAMRNEAFAVIRRVGVATGGSNIQFAVDPDTGERVVIEMNPRVSRSSALASKATGFPIAKIAALLAVGYTLDEIENDITGKTYAAFEPSLDYTVVKIPRWAFEKFPETSPTLGTSMKSVGEVMAIGATFAEALMKGLASLELDRRCRRERGWPIRCDCVAASPIPIGSGCSRSSRRFARAGRCTRSPRCHTSIPGSCARCDTWSSSSRSSAAGTSSRFPPLLRSARASG